VSRPGGSDLELVIVAAGRGDRLGGGLPKAFVRVKGVELVVRTLRRCASVGVFDRAVVAVPGDHVEVFRALVAAHEPWPFAVRAVAGGADRQASVLCCLDAIAAEDGVVVVHDAARPFASAGVFAGCVDRARACGAAVAAVRVPDTLKRGAGARIVGTVDRRALWMVQTPQAFQLSVLRAAHRRALETGYRGTDDAGLVEWAGGRVDLVPGESGNIKITEPGDLLHAERLLEGEAE
jgi:2-C-methyl-D-erythritol 4-phosphate cytidylyltransferase